MIRYKYFLLFFLLIFISSEILYARSISLKQILEMPTEERLELLQISVNSLISDKPRDCPRTLIADYEIAEAKADNIDKDLAAFMIALYKDDPEVFGFLLETIKKGNLNIRFKRNTILHYAVNMNNVKMIRALIEVGVNINALDRYERTPLLIAMQEGHIEAAIVLTMAGANLECIKSLCY